jgi:hypothetical protein
MYVSAFIVLCSGKVGRSRSSIRWKKHLLLWVELIQSPQVLSLDPRMPSTPSAIEILSVHLSSNFNYVKNDHTNQLDCFTSQSRI